MITCARHTASVDASCRPHRGTIPASAALSAQASRAQVADPWVASCSPLRPRRWPPWAVNQVRMGNPASTVVWVPTRGPLDGPGSVASGPFTALAAARRMSQEGCFSPVYGGLQEATPLGMRTGQAARTLLAARAAGAKHPAFCILNPISFRPRHLCPGRRMAPPACSGSRAERGRV